MLQNTVQGELLVANSSDGGEWGHFPGKWALDGAPTAKATVPKLGNGWRNQGSGCLLTVSKPVLVYFPKF